MKPDEKVLNVKGNLSGESIGMTIDSSSLAHIMSVLTNLYSDKELAVLREYSTNAFDAHVDSGVTRPIEVTLPAPLSPFLKIRDYGEGLDAEDIREIYSRYGTSTKRGSNEVVGMLGLGCKSALTYTDQFNVTGIKNGIMTQVSVSVTAEGGGNMTIVDQFPTDEPSGVEVVVPAKSGNTFEAKARNFFRFWREDSVLVNGEKPKRIDGIWVADDLLLTSEVTSPIIVMGNVPYPDPNHYGNSKYRKDGRDFHSVAFVDIGAVNFTPSRESLHVTPRTKNVLEKIENRVETEVHKALMKQIDAAKTSWEALALTKELKPFGLNPEKVTWKGKKLVTTIGEKWDATQHPYGTPRPDPKFFTLRGSDTYSKYYWNSHHAVSMLDYAGDFIWVVGYETDKWTPYKHQKLNQWKSKNGRIDTRYNNNYRVHPTAYIFTEKLPAEALEWIDPARVVEWDTIDAEKIERNGQPITLSGRPTGSYNARVDGKITDKLLAKDIVTDDLKNKPIFWIQGNRWHTEHRLTWLINKYPNATIVYLPGNRIEKFRRDFPMAVHVPEAVKTLGQTWFKSLTKNQKDAYHVQESRNSWLFQLLDEKLVNDTWLSEAAKLSKMDLRDVREDYKFYGRYCEISIDSSWKDVLLTKYPLLSHLSSSVGKNMQHIYLYINAVDSANKGGSI